MVTIALNTTDGFVVYVDAGSILAIRRDERLRLTRLQIHTVYGTKAEIDVIQTVESINQAIEDRRNGQRCQTEYSRDSPKVRRAS